MAHINEPIVVLSSGSEDDEIEIVSVDKRRRRRPRSPPSEHSSDHSIILIESSGSKAPPSHHHANRKRSHSSEIRSPEAIQLQEPDQYGFTDEIISQLEMEQRREVFKKLAEIYGVEDMGFGFKGKVVKLDGEDVPRSFTVTIIPQISHTGNMTKKFYFMVVDDPHNPEYGGAFKVFPPIRVKVEYLTNATREVKIMLTSSWLRKDHVKSLTSSMHDNLLKHHGDIIHCLEWLEKKGVKSLHLVDELGKIYYSSQNLSANHIVFSEPRAVLDMFVRYAARVEDREATGLKSSKVFDCDICFDHKPSLAAHIFGECKHYFCRGCVGQDWEIKIQDAQLNDLTCPAKDCKSKGDMEMIRDLVNFNSFRRYCDLTTESLCDTMAAIVRCPRKECNVPMELHPQAAKEVTCIHCRYQFCSTCKGKQHPNEPCLSEDQKKQIREEWNAADEAGKEALKKRYGADNVKFALEDAESQEWIAKNSKPCPKCKTPIQKIDGCNKMVCTSKGCRTYFCWLCLSVLDTANPYSHFNPGQSECANRLHEGAHGPPNLLHFHARHMAPLLRAPVHHPHAPPLNLGFRPPHPGMVRPPVARRVQPPRARRAVAVPRAVAPPLPGVDVDAHNRAREQIAAARAGRVRVAARAERVNEAARAARDDQRAARNERAAIRAREAVDRVLERAQRPARGQ